MSRRRPRRSNLHRSTHWQIHTLLSALSPCTTHPGRGRVLRANSRADSFVVDLSWHCPAMCVPRAGTASSGIATLCMRAAQMAPGGNLRPGDIDTDGGGNGANARGNLLGHWREPEKKTFLSTASRRLAREKHLVPVYLC